MTRKITITRGDTTITIEEDGDKPIDLTPYLPTKETEPVKITGPSTTGPWPWVYPYIVQQPIWVIPYQAAPIPQWPQWEIICDSGSVSGCSAGTVMYSTEATIQ